MTDALMSLGFPEYESRAYAALAKRGEALSAYQIAREAGLPTSKIYGVLSRLEEKELVAAVDERGKRKYAAMDAEEFLTRYRREVNGAVARVRRELTQLKGVSAATAIWNFRDYDSLRDRAVRIVKASVKSLLVSAWRQELELLDGELRAADSRGVRIVVVHFGDAEVPFGIGFRHPIEDTLFEERGGRGLVMVSDSREAILATIRGESGVEGAYSANRGLAVLAEDYIKHDVYIMKIVRRMDGELIRRFGARYEKLRDIFTDREE